MMKSHDGTAFLDILRSMAPKREQLWGLDIMEVYGSRENSDINIFNCGKIFR